MIHLKEFRREAIERAISEHPEQHGVLINHGLASGKTTTAGLGLVNFNAYQKLLVVPSNVHGDWIHDLKRIGNDKIGSFKLIVHEELMSWISKKNYVVVVDEAHRLIPLLTSNVQWTTEERLKIYKWLQLETFKIFLLTGTPIKNAISDLRILINIAAGSNVIPASVKDFQDMFYSVSERELITKGYLGPIVVEKSFTYLQSVTSVLLLYKLFSLMFTYLATYFHYSNEYNIAKNVPLLDRKNLLEYQIRQKYQIKQNDKEDEAKRKADFDKLVGTKLALNEDEEKKMFSSNEDVSPEELEILRTYGQPDFETNLKEFLKTPVETEYQQYDPAQIDLVKVINREYEKRVEYLNLHAPKTFSQYFNPKKFIALATNDDPIFKQNPRWKNLWTKIAADTSSTATFDLFIAYVKKMLGKEASDEIERNRSAQIQILDEEKDQKLIVFFKNILPLLLKLQKFTTVFSRIPVALMIFLTTSLAKYLYNKEQKLLTLRKLDAKKLLNKISPYIVTYDPFDDESMKPHFPVVTIKPTKISYDLQQTKIVNRLMVKEIDEKDLVELGIFPDETFAQVIEPEENPNLYVQFGRMVGNLGKLPKKFQLIFELYSKNPKPTLIYSNFRKGIQNFAEIAKKNGYNTAYVPLTDANAKQKMIEKAIAGEIHFLLLPPDATEGTSVIGMEVFHILEPCLDIITYQQLKARVIRFVNDLSIHQKPVLINVWIAQFPNLILKEKSKFSLWKEFGSSQVPWNFNKGFTYNFSPDSVAWNHLQAAGLDFKKLQHSLQTLTVQKTNIKVKQVCAIYDPNLQSQPKDSCINYYDKT